MASAGLRDKERSLASRMGALLPQKISVWLGLTVGICVPYFGIQQLGLVAPVRLPETALDGVIPFGSGWMWAYVSLALLVPLAPLLATRREELQRYSAGLALLCAPCFLIFVLFPVEGPRPEIFPSGGLYAFIVSYDRPTNSLPSLHAGLTAYSLLFAAQILRGARWSTPTRALGCVWGVLILYSTLATKQHWVIDLVPGILLAWGAHALAWRPGAFAERRLRDDGPSA